jgi:tricorn protease
MHRRPFLTFLCALVVSLLHAQDESRLLRFPAIHGNQVVFTYAGDLYTVPATGGVARKLTNDVGFEMFARFSPDGKWIAFTGQYDGNTEVYCMPADGGSPRRLTYTATLSRDEVSDRMGPNNIVMTWKGADQIIYRSRQHEWSDWKGQLYAVSVKGGPSVQLPLPRGGWCSFSPDGSRLAYNRVFREFRTWKRYRGGQADDIWIYDFAARTTTDITNNSAQDVFPMWSGQKIYFLSDRDEHKRMNLYVYDLETRQTSTLTDFVEFDIKFPSLGDNAIVFENGGYLYRHDLASGRTEKIPVRIQEDFVTGRGGLWDVSKQVTNYEISPDGNRALFGARGDIFTVPAKYGNTRNLTGTPGVHERNGLWSPDGRWISYISDQTGEDEIWILPQDGKGEAKQLTSGGDTYKYQPVWSPDSKKLLWADKKLRLQYVDVDSRKVTQVAQATSWEFSGYVWSPDSKWIAFARPEEKRMTTIQLYSLDSKETTEVTDGWFVSYAPSFSSDGKYLFFISNRTFNPTYGQTEWNHVYNDMAGIFLVTLAAETRSPFEPKSDEVKVKETERTEGKPDTKAPAAVPVRVDPRGIQTRIAAFPIPGSGYSQIQSVGEKLYYIRNGSRDEKSKLMLFELDKQKETELGEFNGFEISADGKKMLVGQSGAYAIVDLPTAKIDIKDRLNLSDLKVTLDRKAEWTQIFQESWRQMRDFVYDPKLHGVDWPAMRTKYGALIPFVNHRADLTYVIGEMIAELNLGHCYVGGGDLPAVERIPLGLLGAKLERDAATGAYRIVEILKGQNWDRNLRSPLTDIGVRVSEGEYILAVDGRPTREMTDIYASLVNASGKQVTLTVNDSPESKGARDVVVVPTGNELPLYYYTWVQKNIERVRQATDGRVGYIHIPDMGVPGLNEFAKYYYPQLRKDALIVDVRANGGGNVSPMIIERLRREIAMITVARNAAIAPDPGGMVVGPKVMLIDEFSASDGDIVAYRFKKYGLGPVIGKRTWGGVVGIRGTMPFLDGGFLNRPEFSRYDTEGKEWIMEGVGVEPDIVVDNDPAREYDGIDDQLNRAIDVIKEELKKHPVNLPPPPPSPDKSR